MPLTLLTTTAFERDLRRVRKQGRDLDKMEAIVNMLQARKELPVRCHPHPLTRRLGGALGLPRGTGLAIALQSDRSGTDPGSNRQPQRTIRLRIVTEDTMGAWPDPELYS
jgi:hypothetical protein